MWLVAEGACMSLPDLIRALDLDTDMWAAQVGWRDAGSREARGWSHALRMPPGPSWGRCSAAAWTSALCWHKRSASSAPRHRPPCRMQGKFFVRQLMKQVLCAHHFCRSIVPRTERHLPVRPLPASRRR